MKRYLIVTLCICVGIGGVAWYHAHLRSTDTYPPIILKNIMEHTLTFTSTAFKEGETIPPKYTCDGEDTNPPLAWSGAPEGTKSFVLIMDDPDVPKELKPDGIFDHWVLFNIPGDTTELGEANQVGTGGNNSRSTWAYVGPCPPTQFGSPTHRYFFKLYALDIMLDQERGASKESILAAMEGHVLDQASLMGQYTRKH